MSSTSSSHVPPDDSLAAVKGMRRAVGSMLTFKVDPKSYRPKVLASLCDYLFIEQNTFEDEIVGALIVGADPEIRTREEAGYLTEI